VFDIDKAIAEWRRGLRKSESLEDGYVAELESHLRDAIEHRVRGGAEPDEAFRAAVRKLGESGRIAADYFKTDGRSSVEASLRNSSGTLTVLLWNGCKVTFSAMEGDYDFAETLGMHVMTGRFYSREFSSDPSNYVISETAERLIGPGSAIGKRLTVGERTGSVIGVVKDIHTASLHEPILPEVISFSTDCFMCVRFRGRAEDMVRFLEAKWKSAVGERPFRHEFLDEKLSLLYESERRIGTIFRYFTGLAILVACLGLFGLAAFNSARRTKEIGVRKVLGARSARLAAVLSAEFAAWVVIASVIATPVAYFLATRWLGTFAYRIPLGWGIFAFSTALALAIAIFTVGYHALRTARANPVESLRYE